MNFLKRAFLSVWGHKAKTIILFVAFAVIGSMLLGSLAIENTSKQVINDAKENIGCKIFIKPKEVQEGLISEPVYPRIDRQFESELRKINHITLVNKIYGSNLYPKSFKLISDPNEDNQLKTDYCTITALTDTAKYSPFSSGSYKLVAGRHLNKSDTGKNYAMINEKLAEYNKINVGDTITGIVQQEDKALGNKEIDCNYIVIGIYKVPAYTGFEYMQNKFTKVIYTPDNPNLYLGLNQKELPENAKKAVDYLKEKVKNYKPKPENEAETVEEGNARLEVESYKLILKQIEKVPNYFPQTVDDLKESSTIEISVDSPENLDYVLNGLNKINVNDRYEFTTYADQYNRIIMPMKTAKKLSSLFTYVIFSVGLLIMALIVVLSLRSRTHEFGILLALGEKKFKIILQVLVETIIPVAVSFIVAFSTSGFIGQIAAQKIVNDNYKPFNTVITTMADFGEIRSREPSTYEFNVNGVEQIHDVDVSVTTNDVGIFAGCSLLIVILACGIPMIKIVKLSPMNVLTHKD